MSRDHLSSTYTSRTELFSEAISTQSVRINFISLARLLVLVALVWFLVLGIRDQGVFFYILAILFVPLFLFLISLHNKQQVHREFLRQLKTLNEKEAGCLEHTFDDFQDGMQHADPAHPWSHDLDIFGRGSLFQYLNRTSTLRGNQLLARFLTTEPDDLDAIKNRQQITGEWKDCLDFRQNFTARGTLLKETESDHSEISRWLNTSTYMQKNGWLFYLALGTSGLAISIIIAGFINQANFWFLLYLLAFNFILLSPFLARSNRYQAIISKKHQLLEGYAQLLKMIAEHPVEHPTLRANSRKARKGMKEVRKLSKLMNLFDQRLNMLLGAIFNGLFLFDFIMIWFLERWKIRNEQQILDWIEITGWTDAMVSLSGFAFNHPGFVNPEFHKGGGNFEMKGLGHPLIPDHKRVVNDLRIEGEKVVVITGANMAGKSTFLRSLGVNTVLAYAGCPVCAVKYESRIMGLYSSMRTVDSLKDEESYFLAEIKKLQLIVRRMETGRPLLILLDEVLKGTNTTDKKRGSVGLIRRSLQYPIRCFIATHDLSLGELEKELTGQVVNYCFESYIDAMELTFDYTIRKGIATNMNASFLMKQMGIMD